MTVDFNQEYARLKKERDKHYEERIRWESELKTVEAQLAEVEKKIREELGVEPAELEAQVKRLKDEAAELVKKIEKLLKIE
jgi:uncharacterized protein involved in exopolysaccharide biosynthesis